jgi:hypothetical protein
MPLLALPRNWQEDVMKPRTLFALLTICVVFLGVPSSSAQNTTGAITGRLTDSTGAVISGAKVTVKNLGTGEVRTLTTGASGDFTATLLLPGRYSVTAEHSGFKTAIRNDITLEVDQTVRADLALDVGSEAQKVEVTGQRAHSRYRQHGCGADHQRETGKRASAEWP